MSKFLFWYMVAAPLVAAIANVLLIDHPRKPITRGQAAGALIGALVFSTLLLIYGAAR